MSYATEAATYITVLYFLCFLERPYTSQKYRHNSADDDYYSAAYNGYHGYYNGYGYEKYGTHYRSQPSLFRRCDAKYTHPNARFAQVINSFFKIFFLRYFKYPFTYQIEQNLCMHYKYTSSS